MEFFAEGGIDVPSNFEDSYSRRQLLLSPNAAGAPDNASILGLRAPDNESILGSRASD
jgi:hypothetical protein